MFWWPNKAQGRRNSASTGRSCILWESLIARSSIHFDFDVLLVFSSVNASNIGPRNHIQQHLKIWESNEFGHHYWQSAGPCPLALFLFDSGARKKRPLKIDIEQIYRVEAKYFTSFLAFYFVQQICVVAVVVDFFLPFCVCCRNIEFDSNLPYIPAFVRVEPKNLML